MARILVLDKNNGPFELNDVIHIIEDGAQFGRLEGPPDFQIVEFPGVPASDLRKYTSQLEETPEDKQVLSIRKLKRISRWLDDPNERKVLKPCRYSLNPATKQFTDKRRP